MQMQMAKWKRTRADRAQDVKVRIGYPVHYDMNTAAIVRDTVVHKSKETLKHVRISVTLDVSHKIGSDLTTDMDLITDS